MNTAKTRVAKVCAASLLLGLCTGVAQARSVALLIGVGDYGDQQLDIPGVDVDLDNAAKLVRGLGVADADIVRLFNQQATVARVEAQLQGLAQQLSSDDQLILYVSTHGLQLRDQNGDERDGRDEALALADFAVGSAGDAQPIQGVLRDDRLGELLAALPTTRILVIADTCHSGTISKTLGDGLEDVLNRVGKFIQLPRWLRGEGNAVVETGLQELNQPGVVLLSAAGDGELADIDERGSAFTRALIETQRSEADTAWCWFQRARAVVREDTQGVQLPQFSGEFQRAVAPLQGGGRAIDGVPLLQHCSSDPRFSASVQRDGAGLKLSAVSGQAGWLTAVSVRQLDQSLELQSLSSRWHHGRDRQLILGGVQRVADQRAGAWVLWTADGVDLPRHRGNFSVLWQGLQGLPSDQWASAYVPGVSFDGH